jgi:glycosyltransferase involved in cell wall biosynthesis
VYRLASKSAKSPSAHRNGAWNRDARTLVRQGEVTMPPCYYLLVVRFPTGGIRTHLKYFRALAPLRPDRLQPVLVCPEGEQALALAKNLDLPAELNLSKGVRSLSTMARTVFSATRQFDVRLIHSHGFTSAAVAAPTALLERRAHLVTVHDVITEGVLERASRSERLGLGLAMRLAQAVHAVSNDCAASLRLLPFMGSAHSIVVIPNGIDAGQFSGVAPRDIRSDLGLSPSTFLIGFFSRFMAQKGFRTLVDSIGLLKSIKGLPPIVVVAVGSGGFIREDQSYIERRGLGPSFRFMDSVENPAPLIAAVDCVAMPSRWEAYGLLGAEVLALGIPLLASNCIGLREVTSGTPARTFPPNDPAALASTIAAEIDTPTKGRSAEFVHEALRRFDFKPKAARIENLIQKLHHGQGVAGTEAAPARASARQRQLLALDAVQRHRW